MRPNIKTSYDLKEEGQVIISQDSWSHEPTDVEMSFGGWNKEVVKCMGIWDDDIRFSNESNTLILNRVEFEQMCESIQELDEHWFKNFPKLKKIFYKKKVKTIKAD